jgi:hypothetical protein
VRGVFSDFDTDSLLRMGRVIGGRVASIEEDGQDTPAKRRWREGLQNVPPVPMAARWRVVAVAVVVTALGLVTFAGTLWLLITHG